MLHVYTGFSTHRPLTPDCTTRIALISIAETLEWQPHKVCYKLCSEELRHCWRIAAIPIRPLDLLLIESACKLWLSQRVR